MPAYGIIGAQWGDEGKGKVVDFLAERADMVVRFSGGNNAGHTVINDFGEFALHLVPAGIFWPHAEAVIGPGVVIDPGSLIDELTELQARDIDTSRLLISDHAHVVMPYHVQLDRFEEAARGAGAIGTTGKGIGPTYVDKTSRVGIRMGDLLDEAYLRTRLEGAVRQKNAVLTKLYGAEPIDLDELYEQCLEHGRRWEGRRQGGGGSRPQSGLLVPDQNRGAGVGMYSPSFSKGTQGNGAEVDEHLGEFSVDGDRLK